MVQIRRDGESLRIVLIEGSVSPPEVVEMVRAQLNEIQEVIIELPGAPMPSRSTVGEVIRDVSAEAFAHGAMVRYSL